MNNTTLKKAFIAAPLVAGATLGSWVAWLSWQTGYRTDPVTGAQSGPYAWWQVAGCVITLAVVAGVAGRWLNPLLIVPIMAIVFTGAWSAQAAPSDESGLWVVGAVLVLFGTAAGAAVVSGASWLLRRRGVPAR